MGAIFIVGKSYSLACLIARFSVVVKTGKWLDPGVTLKGPTSALGVSVGLQHPFCDD